MSLCGGIMIEEIKNLKKVELHIHLDGSVVRKAFEKLTNRDFAELKKDVVANKKCKNLSEYLTKFDVPISLLQSKENLQFVASELVNYLESQNVIYAEVRFAPMFHTKNGLTYEEIIEAVLKGFSLNKNVKTNLILCMMRGADRIDNIKTIDTAIKYLNNGVCAIDIAGAEDKYPLDDYVELFEYAKKHDVPFTIHAGETGSFKEVEKAINLGAKRIGHGIHAIDDNDVLNLVKEKEILLEICPTSNVQTNAVDYYENHPVKDFYKDGVKVSLNTDNITVSDITLNEEYIKLHEHFGFDIKDFTNMNINAIMASFLRDDDKEKFLNLIK